MVIHHHEDAIEHHDDHDNDHDSPLSLAFSGFRHFANNREDTIVPQLDSYQRNSNFNLQNYFIDVNTFQKIIWTNPVAIIFPDNPSPPFSPSYPPARSFRGPPLS